MKSPPRYRGERGFAKSPDLSELDNGAVINQPQCSDVVNSVTQRGAEQLLKRGNMRTQVSQLV